jgi:response regulator RpfG family c-di-GMP phosphodiesterase
MPEMDGYELARRIRESEAGGTRTVILAFTANTLREAADECRAAGMDDLITKPIELAELRTKLESWLPLRTSGVSVGSAGGANQKLPFDAELVEEFCLAHEEDLELMRHGVSQRDHDCVARAGHRIKGAARMFGDEMLAEMAEHLEDMARARAGWDDVEFAVTRVSAETERLFARTGWLEKKRA